MSYYDFPQDSYDPIENQYQLIQEAISDLKMFNQSVGFKKLFKSKSEMGELAAKTKHMKDIKREKVKIFNIDFRHLRKKNIEIEKLNQHLYDL